MIMTNIVDTTHSVVFSDYGSYGIVLISGDYCSVPFRRKLHVYIILCLCVYVYIYVHARSRVYVCLCVLRYIYR